MYTKTKKIGQKCSLRINEQQQKKKTPTKLNIYYIKVI